MQTERTVTVVPLVLKCDQRGSVCEPIDEERLHGQRNVHVVINQPGCIRGNHYHSLADEMALVYGPSRVWIREEGHIRTVDIPSGEAWRIYLPAGVSHAIQNTGSQPAVIVSFSTQPHDPIHPDTHKDDLAH
jgi:UDP-2-acetamido-2,6-beta-L-arabino-hexul-4-ose reductase